MKAKVTVTDENGLMFGQFEIDKTWVDEANLSTYNEIGFEVVDQLPGGVKFLTKENREVMKRTTEPPLCARRCTTCGYIEVSGKEFTTRFQCPNGCNE